MNSTKPVALVTGATRGVGLETAAMLAEAGYDVLVGARDSSGGDRAVKVLDERGLTASPVVIDVSGGDSVTAAAAWVGDARGRLDLLVNNAAVHFDHWQDAAGADLAVVAEALDTNLLGPWRVTQAFLPLLRAAGRARVVNVSTEMASTARFAPGSPAYRVSKTALNTLTRLLAADLADAGITVVAASPGWTATDMGGPGGRPVTDGAASVVHAALAEDVSAGFYQDGAPLPW